MTKKSEPQLTGLEIAVIGMSGRFPGARDIDEFWDNLKNGRETITFFSDDELEEAGMASHLIENSDYIGARPMLDDKDCFDALFFGYKPKEAEVMAPQIRLYFECTWSALEDAGYEPGAYQGLIGCYAGASSTLEWLVSSVLSGKYQHLGMYTSGMLGEKDNLSTIISYKLDLKGPSFTFSTNCSTSLVAVHLGCRALLTGECHMALAGGIAVDRSGEQGYLYQEGMFYSQDGHCRTFDARTSGMVLGEGVGVVVLKRLRDAIDDDDHIYAVIKGSAVNNDGADRVGYTAPGTIGQRDVIKLAREVARVEPESITYIETHGTGTPLGDSIEMKAMTQAFNTGKKHFCAIGSLKTNMGHLDAAAGVTGLIKTVLALKYRLLPPSLHFDSPHPQIDFENSPFYVNNRLMEWKNNGYPLRAGINSFGIGGTNAHVIVEENPVTRTFPPASREYQLLLLSAKTESALEGATKNLAQHLAKKPDINLADAAYTLQVGRKAFQYRRMMVCPTDQVKDAINALSSADSSNIHTFFSEKENNEVVFMFAGLGNQYVNMGRQLYETEPLFQEEMNRCFEILKPLVEYDIKEILYPTHPAPSGHPSQEGSSGESPDINQTEIAQLTVFMMEYAMARLLMSWGIKPKAMIGYSFGEYTAACISGVLSLEHALKLVAARGRLMNQTGEGAMLSVPLPVEQVKPLIDEKLSIAIDNGASSVVAGGVTAVEAFEKQLKTQRLMGIRLETTCAVHSKMMDPILTQFQEVLERNHVKLNKPGIPYISNVTGDWLTEQEAVDHGYWVKHLRQTVQFAPGLNLLLKKENAIFLEIGPGRALSTQLAQEPGKKSSHLMVNFIRHAGDSLSDVYYLLDRIGRLWLYGVKIDWQAFYKGKEEQRIRIPLPTYPFERQRYQADLCSIQDISNSSSSPIQAEPSTPCKLPDISRWFYNPSWKPSWIPPVDKNGQSPDRTGKTVLILIDENGLGIQLAERLQKEDHEVILVKRGPSFAKAGKPGEADTYTMDPGQPEHYAHLFKDLREKNQIPVRIFHLWGITGSRGGSMVENLDHFLAQGFNSLLYLTRAISRQEIMEDIHVLVVSDNMQDVTGQEELRPEKATVLSACNVISQEYSNISCRSIDIVLSDLLGAEAGAGLEEKLINQLSAELYVESTDTVVYRGNHRWIRVYEPLLLPESITRFSPLKQEGVYLITGGLGGIGFVLARHLAQQYKAKVILTGRTVLPAREQWEQQLSVLPAEDPVSGKIKKLQELEALGAEMMALSADVADEQQMRQVISRAEKRFGTINGVFHTAGYVERDSISIINDMDMNQCQLHFQPKIHGLLVLNKIFVNDRKPLDFCLLMSSISSVLGGLGLVAYAAANLFMDAFVQKQNRQNHSKWISVAWDGWRTPDTPQQEGFSAAAWEDFAMSPEEGIESVLRILSMEDPVHVVHSTGDLTARIKQWLSLESLRQTHSSPANEKRPASYQRPSLATPYIAPQNKLERMITDVWQKFLGIDRVGVNDNFFDLHVTSLDIVRVNSMLKDVLKMDIPVVTMFNYPSIGALSQFLSKEQKEGNGPDDEIHRAEAIQQGHDRVKNIRSRIKRIERE